MAPQFYAVGGGTLDETIAFEKVQRFLELMKALQSSEGCRDDDLISVITCVNEMKLNRPEEYTRALAWIRDTQVATS